MSKSLGGRRRAAVATVMLIASLVPLGGAAPAAAKTTPGSLTDACGPLIARPGGGTWTCSLVDNFDGTALSPYRWGTTRTAEAGFTLAGDCFVDSPDNVKVENGALRLTARKVAPFTCSSPRGDFTTSYTSGMVTSFGRWGQTYGRFEFRAKFPATKVAGLHSAIWLWPASANKYGAWPASGEIDVAEFYTIYPARVVPYVHYNGDGLDPNATNTKCYVTNPESYHDYLVEWTQESITVKYDGKVCIRDFWKPIGDQVKPQPFDQPFVMNLTQGIGGQANAVTTSTPLPGSMYVDRVRVWR